MSARVRVKFREVGEVGEVIGALGAVAELWSYPLRAVVENELLRRVDSSLLLREAERKKSRVENDDRIQVLSRKRVDSRARILGLPPPLDIPGLSKNLALESDGDGTDDYITLRPSYRRKEQGLRE